MFETLISDPTTVALGAATGLVFGFLLERGAVARFDTIVGQLLFRDFTMMRVMLSAILVGSIGIHGMIALGWIDGIAIKGAQLAANVAGGATLGVGMAILGLCPGTAVVAAGAGARDAWSGLFGMLLGAGLYAELDPWFATNLAKVGALGKVTLAQQFGGNTTLYLVGLTVVVLGVLLVLPRGRASAAAA